MSAMPRSESRRTPFMGAWRSGVYGWDAARGYQGNRAKLSPFETGIRTPIFVRWPGRIEPLRDDETLASIIDLAPTILHLTGVKAPGNLPGLVLTDRAAMTTRTTVRVEAYMHDIVDLADPRKSLTSEVVIDEVVGQLLTYSLLPLAGRAWTGWSFEVALVVGFFLFRGLDIVKPGPIDDCQKLHGGLGIMADDFLAGIVGACIMLAAAMLL